MGQLNQTPEWKEKLIEEILSRATKVVVNKELDSYVPHSSQVLKLGYPPDVILVRDDGWQIATFWAFFKETHNLWRDKWKYMYIFSCNSLVSLQKEVT